jgi:hypothetical protein
MAVAAEKSDSSLRLDLHAELYPVEHPSQYNTDEIAERTGRSRRTIERALHSFRERLTALLFEDT